MNVAEGIVEGKTRLEEIDECRRPNQGDADCALRKPRDCIAFGLLLPP